MRLYALTSTLFLSIIVALAANDTSVRIFNSDFRTLKTEVDNEFLTAPIIDPATGQKLSISFDQMSDDFDYLRYNLVHCNADWTPSSLLPNEYASGFNEASITDYEFSSGTFRHYVNYLIELPSEELSPRISGNYLLRVWPESDPDSTILQTRFGISENIVGVTGEASPMTDFGADTGFQQVNLRINLGNLKVRNPYTDIIVKVTQNRRPDMSRIITTPLRVENNLLIYEHNKDLIFPAGNEYRRFETVRTDYPGMHIDKSYYEGDGYTAQLVTDEPRSSKPYYFDSTQFGRFKVRAYNTTNADLGADYVNTVFTLDFPEVYNADIFIDGELTGHSREEQYKMKYNHRTGLYELPLMLKQGSYNYQYLAVPTDSYRGETSLIEGDYSETRNEYTIEVFLRTPGLRGDRMIANTQIYSNL